MFSTAKRLWKDVRITWKPFFKNVLPKVLWSPKVENVKSVENFAPARNEPFEELQVENESY